MCGCSCVVGMWCCIDVCRCVEWKTGVSGYGCVCGTYVVRVWFVLSYMPGQD
jgi:hypothetical protein